MSEVKKPSVVDVELARKEMKRTGKNKYNKDFVYYVFRSNGDIDWIDLSTLPKNTRGSIDWKNTDIKTICYFNKQHKKIKISFSHMGKFRNSVMTINNRHSKNVSDIKGMKFNQIFDTPHRINLEDKDTLKYNYPNLIQFLENKDDAITYSKKSNKKIKVRCKKCTNTTDMKVSTFTIQNGYVCSRCRRYISYPELWFMALLESNKITYEHQKVFEGLPNRRFDYLIYLDKKPILVELNGIQHYQEQKGSNWKDVYKNTQVSDKEKYKFCKDNNIPLVNVDCKKSEFNYIEKEVLKSLNITVTNKEYMKNYIEEKSSYPIKEILKYYDKTKSTYAVSDKFKIHQSVIVRLLKKHGTTLNGNIKHVNKYSNIIKDYKDGKPYRDICSEYNISEAQLYKVLRDNNVSLRVFTKVKCIETGEIFKSIAEAGRRYNFSKGVCEGISKVCDISNNRKTAGGYHWEYVDNE